MDSTRPTEKDEGREAHRAEAVAAAKAVDRAKAKKGESWGETIRTVFYAVLIALGVRTFLYEPFNIPSESMVPTLLVGDYLFVSKFSYGYSRHSFPWSLGPIDGRIFDGDGPERGDVVVFKAQHDGFKDYIKRVVGLPGDRVQVREGLLYVNGAPVARRPVGDLVHVPPTGIGYPVVEYVETLPNGVRHRIFERTDTGPADETREFVVPEGHYFVMGDNRDNSNDSRLDVGFVPAENLVGRAEFIFFSLAPVNGDTRFWEVWKWPQAIRWDRLFTSID